MPDHDLFDLDDAFSALERDIATVSSPRGAGQALASARRRRRTTYGAIAAVAVLAVGGVAIGQGMNGRSGSVGPSDQPLPPPTPLSAAAFSTATAGWVDGWGKPNETQANSLDTVKCLGSEANSGALDHATRTGGDIYGAGSTEVVYALGMEFTGDKIDAAMTALSDSVASCGPTATATTTYADGSQATFYQLPATSGSDHVELWTARFGDRLGLAVMGGTTNEPPADVVGHVDDLLIGALQVDGTFTQSPDGAVSSGSATASAGDFGTVAETDFLAALGAWPNGWQMRGTTGALDQLPCAGDWTVGSSSGAGASLGANGDQELYSFDSAEDARSSVQALAGDLQACAASPATVTVVAGTGTLPVTVAVGSGNDARVTWIVQRGASVGYISIPGDTTPPALVSEAVAGLLGDALNHVSSSEAPPPVEQSAPAVQQSSGSSSSSGSASASAVPKN
jgi:hypothetical protein